MPGKLIRFRIAGQSVKVGDEIKAIILGLKLQMLAYCAEVIADMKPA
jgi:hypothetical protein